MNENILVTGASSVGRSKRNYFHGLLILINSVYKYMRNDISKIYVCNFGLLDYQINMLNEYNKVSIIEVPKHIYDKFDSLNIKHYKYYCYRQYLLTELLNSKQNTNILWLDAGVCFIDNAREIYSIINDYGIYVVEHDDQNIGNWINKIFIEKLNVQDYELNNSMIFGGNIGINTDSSFKNIFYETYNYMCDFDLLKSICKDKLLVQTIPSILVDRLNIQKQNHRKFSEDIGIKTTNDQYIFVHRCFKKNSIFKYWKINI